MGAPVRQLQIRAAWYVLYEPLAKGLAGPRFLLPHRRGHHHERPPGTDALRPLFLGQAQDLGQTGLGLGDGPDAVGLVLFTVTLLSGEYSPL